MNLRVVRNGRRWRERKGEPHLDYLALYFHLKSKSKWSIQSYSLSMKTSLVHYGSAPNSSNRGNISISSPDASYYAYRMWKMNRSHSKYATITKTTIISSALHQHSLNTCLSLFTVFFFAYLEQIYLEYNCSYATLYWIQWF